MYESNSYYCVYRARLVSQPLSPLIEILQPANRQKHPPPLETAHYKFPHLCTDPPGSVPISMPTPLHRSAFLTGRQRHDKHCSGTVLQAPSQWNKVGVALPTRLPSCPTRIGVRVVSGYCVFYRRQAFYFLGRRARMRQVVGPVSATARAGNHGLISGHGRGSYMGFPSPCRAELFN